MAIDHLEAMDLYQRLPTIEYWVLQPCYKMTWSADILIQDHSTYHPLGLDALVFDHRRGGRIKWAGDLVLEETARDPLNVSTTTFNRLTLSTFLYTVNEHSNCADNEDAHGRR